MHLHGTMLTDKPWSSGIAHGDNTKQANNSDGGVIGGQLVQQQAGRHGQCGAALDGSTQRLEMNDDVGTMAHGGDVQRGRGVRRQGGIGG